MFLIGLNISDENVYQKSVNNNFMMENLVLVSLVTILFISEIEFLLQFTGK